MNRPFLFLVVVAAGVLAALPGASEPAPAPGLLGRWDVTVHAGRATYPSWFEITSSEGKLAGRFVGRGGSARPIAKIEASADHLVFSLPEGRQGEIRFDGQLKGDRLEGKSTQPGEPEATWEAVRSPSLARTKTPSWGTPRPLFNGRDLEGWKTLGGGSRNGWRAKEGVLANVDPGTNVATTETFNDFKLHVEFRLPKESNSGVYLRGRYEVQIADDTGKPPESHGLGGLYGFIAPRVNAGRPAGEWQAFDITLVGRLVSVALNGQALYERQEIPGITGGAIDSNEAAPGPIYLQGDHGQVDFRELVLTPAT